MYIAVRPVVLDGVVYAPGTPIDGVALSPRTIAKLLDQRRIAFNVQAAQAPRPPTPPARKGAGG